MWQTGGVNRLHDVLPIRQPFSEVMTLFVRWSVNCRIKLVFIIPIEFVSPVLMKTLSYEGNKAAVCIAF